MAELKLNGNTSGSVTLSAPDVAGSSVLTLPATTQTLATQNALGVRNRIINGDMRIDQRNAGASVTVANGSITYITDRWNIYEDTAGGISAQQSTTAPPNFTHSFLTTVTSASTATAGQLCRLQHRIEGLNTADLGWGTSSAKSITISFWVRSSLTGTYCVSVRNSTVSRSYVDTYTISSADTWEQKSITITGDTSGTWLTDNGVGFVVSFDLGSGSDANTTAGSWVASNKENTSAQANWIGTASATFYITGVQLEVGDTATPFEHRPYDMELARCRRYFEKRTNYIETNAPGVNAYANWSFKTTMRASPTITNAGGTGTIYNISVDGASSFATSYANFFNTATADAEL